MKKRNSFKLNFDLKKNIKKYAIYIATIPFIIIIVKAIYCLFAGYTKVNGIEYHGLKALSEFILNDIVMGNIFVTIFLIVCMVYLAYYCITVKGNASFKIFNKKIYLKDLVFIIGLIPIVYIIIHALYSCIFGYESTMLFTTTMIYGFDAMYDSIMMDILTLTFMPVLPISIIYDAVYITIRVRERKYGK